MRLFTKISLGLAAIVISIAIAPCAKADAITITTGGFNATGVGNDGTGAPGMDAVDSYVHTSTIDINGASSFVALLNPLTFTTGFTGLNSGGPHPFTVAEGLTINGQTQGINFVDRIAIAYLRDTMHLTTPLSLS